MSSVLRCGIVVGCLIGDYLVEIDAVAYAPFRRAD